MKRSEIEILERQGCFADDWSAVEISEDTDLRKIRNVYFRGPVTIGANTEIINVPGGLANVRIGDNVRIVNVASIENTADATYGVGTEIAVLDETGTRPVKIYPGISAQIAAIAARMPEYAAETLSPLIDNHIHNLPDLPEIGDGAEILNCGPLSDIRVWPEVKLEGASRLHNGSIVNNQESRTKSQEPRVKDQESRTKDQESRTKDQESRVKDQESRTKSQEPRVKDQESGVTGQAASLAYVGPGVDAENFIIEDAMVSGGALLRNTYVGQGCVIDKGFTAHDSLFFSNCSMENGEACAVLAGPYTVSMHKSSLLIGCQTGFMNAGSGTNMSNHMYKLGPKHWGVLERGVKTSSNAYIMHGSRIGAFSLVMGEHKTHPDTSEFPFSYLFGDSKGNTTVVPGAMLKSYGLKRDAEKWPKRDRRLNHGLKLNDRITYSILNPYTADMMVGAIAMSQKLLSSDADAQGYISHKGMKLKKSSLEKGINLYELALCKYLQILQEKGEDCEINGENIAKRWVDLSGQIIDDNTLNEVLAARSITDMEYLLDKALRDFDINEQQWAKERITKSDFKDAISAQRATEFDKIVESDRQSSLNQLSLEKDMLGII